MAFKFTKTHDPDNKFDLTDVTIEIRYNDISRCDLFDAFVEFCRACGYTINGELQVIEEDEAPSLFVDEDDPEWLASFATESDEPKQYESYYDRMKRPPISADSVVGDTGHESDEAPELRKREPRELDTDACVVSWTELKTLRDTVRYYADTDNWRVTSKGDDGTKYYATIEGDLGDDETSMNNWTGGYRARQALNRTELKKGEPTPYVEPPGRIADTRNSPPKSFTWDSFNHSQSSVNLASELPETPENTPVVREPSKP